LAIKARYAHALDSYELASLGEIMHSESPRYSKYPYDGDKTEAILRGQIESPTGVCVVVENEDEIIGAIIGGVAEFYFSTARYAYEIAVYVDPAHRGTSALPRMLKLFEDRARELGAVEFAPGISTECDPERTQRLYEHLGCRVVGVLMAKDL
jgi:RimJ/RimL family protein N-acetyltransferase